jgi:hypothetical protein
MSFFPPKGSISCRLAIPKMMLIRIITCVPSPQVVDDLSPNQYTDHFWSLTEVQKGILVEGHPISIIKAGMKLILLKSAK